MNDIVIRVKNLSKQYKIGAAPRYDRLKDLLTHGLKDLFIRNSQSEIRNSPSDTIWALKDVSFEVKQGETLGIIGANGAGKSTLLKLLSRITEPTSGRAEIYGKVGSLLEVGTGFDRELTGRENIYLNGAILGMTNREIDRKFEEIVDFSGVDKFIDTPVKRYSSGMHVRLAFAVAAHLEPEILIVDEVLAVGDAEFQKKCLGKMGNVTKEGRTVLFVSHNMAAIKSLCSRAILLDSGDVACDGTVDQVVDTYLVAGNDMSRTGLIPENAPRIGTGEAKIRSVQLSDPSGRDLSQLYFGQPFRVKFSFEVLTEIPDALVEVGITTIDGTHVIYSTSIDGEGEATHLAKGRYVVEAEFDIVLLPRLYSITLGIHHLDGTTADFVQRVLDFKVLRIAQNGSDHYRPNRVRGYVRGPARWRIGKSTQ